MTLFFNKIRGYTFAQIKGVVVHSGEWINALQFQINDDGPKHWAYTDTYGVEVNDRNQIDSLNTEGLNIFTEIKVSSDLDYIRTLEFTFNTCE